MVVLSREVVETLGVGRDSQEEVGQWGWDLRSYNLTDFLSTPLSDCGYTMNTTLCSCHCAFPTLRDCIPTDYETKETLPPLSCFLPNI